MAKVGEHESMIRTLEIHEFNRLNKQLLSEQIIDQFDELRNTKFDLFQTFPHQKSVSTLNLTDACAEDVEFFRDSRKRYKYETNAITQCQKRNDSECAKMHSDNREKVAWTLGQLDSFGKIPPGLLRINQYWHGSYGECLSIDVDRPKNSTGRYQGKYCYAMMSIKSLLQGVDACPSVTDDYTKYLGNIRWAICIPKTCTDKDALALVQQYDKIKTMACNVFCIEEKEEFTASAIVVIVLFSIIGLIVVISTIIDYVQKNTFEPLYPKTRPKNFATEILLCFSLYTNGMKILDMSKKSGQFDCLHGIRVLSMLWVILGHTYLHIEYADNLIDVSNVVKEWSVQIINNATFSVDTFFTMSGFLVAYLWFKEEEKLGSKFVKSKGTWIWYYVHRYIRLTPVFMLILGMNATLAPYFTRGPHQYDALSAFGQDCSKTWWTNLLYVNNLVYPIDQCYGPAWYLPNDMQFYALAPAIFLLLLFSPTLGFLTSIVLIFASMASTAATIAVYRFPPMPLFGAPIDPESIDKGDYSADFMRLVYMAPWARFPTYLIGVLFGFAWQKRLSKVKLNMVATVIGWLLACAVALAIIFGLCDYVKGHQIAVGLRALYGAVSRPIWSLCICWLMFACLTGRGGPINELLSWRGWLPLSRLSYCIYLLHFSIIKVIFASNEYAPHWDTHMDWICKWLGVLGMTTLASFFVSCAFEAPIISLEKLLLHPKKREDPVADVIKPTPQNESVNLKL